MQNSMSNKLKSLVCSNTSFNLLQPINIKIELKTQRPYQIVNEEQHSIAKPNFSNIKLDAQCIKQIYQQLNKGKFSKEGVLLSYQSLSQVKKLHFFTEVSQQEDLTSLIQNEECLCVGIFIVNDTNSREDRASQFIKRIRNQMKFCMEYKSGTGTNRHAENYSKLSDIGKLYCKQSRMFAIFEKKKNSTIMHTLHYYPNISFSVRQIKLQPQKIKQGEVLDRIAHMKYPKNSYGYMTQDIKGGFIFEDKNNPKINKLILVGVWIVGEQGLSKNYKDKQQVIERRNKLFWRVIVEYLRKPKLKRVSTLQENTGILAYFERKTLHRKLYLFDLNGFENKWDANYSYQVIDQVPQQINFSKKCNQGNQGVKQSQQYSQNRLRVSDHNEQQQSHSKVAINNQERTTKNSFTKNLIKFPCSQQIRNNNLDRQMHAKSPIKQRVQKKIDQNCYNINQGYCQQKISNFQKLTTSNAARQIIENFEEQEYSQNGNLNKVNHMKIHDHDFQMDINSNRQLSQCRSFQSVDQRDVEIALLKKDLEMYKAKYQELKRVHEPMFNCFMNIISSGIFQNGTFMIHGINNQFDLMNGLSSCASNSQIKKQPQQQKFNNQLNKMREYQKTRNQSLLSPTRSNKQKKNIAQVSENQRRQLVKKGNLYQHFQSNHQQQTSEDCNFNGKQQITFARQQQNCRNIQNHQQQECQQNIPKSVANNFLKKNYSLERQMIRQEIQPQSMLSKKLSLPITKNYQDQSGEESDKMNQIDDYKNISFGDNNSRFRESVGRIQSKGSQQEANISQKNSQQLVQSKNKANATKIKQFKEMDQSGCFNKSPQFKLTQVQSFSNRVLFTQQEAQKRLQSANIQSMSLFRQQNHSEDSNSNQQTKRKDFDDAKDRTINNKQKQTVITKGKASVRQTRLKYGLDSSDEQYQCSLGKGNGVIQKQNVRRNNKKSSSDSNDSDSDENSQIIKKLTRRYQQGKQATK